PPTAILTTEARRHGARGEKPLHVSVSPWWNDDPATRAGLLAALAYAVLPLVAVQNRFGYTYNGLAFWTALALLALLRYRRDRRGGSLILCGLAGAAA